MTDYYRSASAHNVVLIDGKGPDRSSMAFHEKIKPAGEDFDWERLDDLEIATGVSKGGWKATSIAQSGRGTRFDPDYVFGPNGGFRSPRILDCAGHSRRRRLSQDSRVLAILSRTGGR